MYASQIALNRYKEEVVVRRDQPQAEEYLELDYKNNLGITFSMKIEYCTAMHYIPKATI